MKPSQYSPNEFRHVRNKLHSQEELNLSDCIALLAAIDQNALNREETQKAVEAIASVVQDPKILIQRRSSPSSKTDIHLLNKARLYGQSYQQTLLARFTKQHFMNILKNWAQAYRHLKTLAGLTGQRGIASKVTGETKLEEEREQRLKILAKDLAVNNDFQMVLSKVRSQWNIVPRYPPSADLARLTSDDVLLDAVSASGDYTAQRWQRLENQIRHELSDSFPQLAWVQHRALLIGALCFGLTPDDVERHWPLLYMIARQRPLHEDVEIRISDDEKRMGALIALAYLDERIRQLNRQALVLPEPVQSWVNFARTTAEGVGVGPTNFDEAPTIIQAMSGRPDDLPAGEIILTVRIHPYTQLDDLTALWPRISIKQLAIWGRQPRKRDAPAQTHSAVVLEGLLNRFNRDWKKAILEHDRELPDFRITENGVVDTKQITSAHIDVAKKRLRRLKGRRKSQSDGT